MICKVCNASIDDNAQVCPFCGNNVTVDVDPGMNSGFPDPAAQQGGSVDLNKPASQPSADDPGLSEPAQYTDPYANNVNSAPNGQPVQPDYAQNDYSQNNYGSQNGYNENSYGGYNAANEEYEKEAKTIMTLGIVAIAVGFCCCAIVGPICGGIGLSKYSKFQNNLMLLSPDGQKNANTGRLLCIIGIIVGAVSMVIGAIGSITGTTQQILQNLQQ